MKAKKIFVCVVVALLAACVPFPEAFAVTVDFTAGEGFVAGNLEGQQLWTAQGQWQVDPTGTGTATTVGSENPGAFIRGQFTGAPSPNEVGNVLELIATFTLGGNFGLRDGDADGAVPPSADWMRGIFNLGLSADTVSPAPPIGLEAGLYLAADNTNLALWVDNPVDAVDLGAASNYDGHTWVLSVTYTKTSETEYSVDATIDSLQDEAGAFMLSKTTLVPGDAPGTDVIPTTVPLQGAFIALPVSGNAPTGGQGGVNHYDGINIDSISFTATPAFQVDGDFDGDLDIDGADFLAWQRGESPNGVNSGDLAEWRSNYNPPQISAVPEPSTLGLLCLAATGMIVRRKRC